MMRKKKHFYTVICMVIGVIILTTAAAANFENANGYTAYKTALKNMLDVDNFSADLTIEMLYNDTTAFQAKQRYMFDEDGDVIEYSAMTERDGERNFSNENWKVRDLDASDDESEFISINRNGTSWNINRSYSGGGFNIGINDDEVSRKAIRFAELLADTFVGDLKNNFVLTSDENGVKSYQIILSGNQLPEYVSAGLSMMYSAAKQSSNSFVVYDKELDTAGEDFGQISSDAWNMLSEKNHKGVVYVKADGEFLYFATSDLYYQSEYYKPDMTQLDDVFRAMQTEPTVETAKCFITIDKEGRLLSNTIEGTLSAFDKAGNKHALTLRVNAELSDYGTTVIAPPVIPEADTVYDYSESNQKNNFSYTVTENGVVKTYDNGKYPEALDIKEGIPADAEAVPADPDQEKESA